MQNKNNNSKIGISAAFRYFSHSFSILLYIYINFLSRQMFRTCVDYPVFLLCVGIELKPFGCLVRRGKRKKHLSIVLITLNYIFFVSSCFFASFSLFYRCFCVFPLSLLLLAAYFIYLMFVVCYYIQLNSVFCTWYVF